VAISSGATLSLKATISRAAGCAELRNAPLPLLRRPLGMSTAAKQARYRRFPR
jgi:hypothetical protein